jgi:hypothetical protein
MIKYVHYGKNIKLIDEIVAVVNVTSYNIDYINNTISNKFHNKSMIDLLEEIKKHFKIVKLIKLDSRMMYDIFISNDPYPYDIIAIEIEPTNLELVLWDLQN